MRLTNRPTTDRPNHRKVHFQTQIFKTNTRPDINSKCGKAFLLVCECVCNIRIRNLITSNQYVNCKTSKLLLLYQYLSHVSHGEPAKRREVDKRLNAHGLAGDKSHDAGVSRLDELGIILGGLTQNGVWTYNEFIIKKNPNDFIMKKSSQNIFDLFFHRQGRQLAILERQLYLSGLRSPFKIKISKKNLDSINNFFFILDPNSMRYQGSQECYTSKIASVG